MTIYNGENMKGNFEKLRIEIFGESHAEEVGVKLGGIPDGCALTLANVNNLLDRRKSRGGVWATPRKEADEPVVLGGLIKTDSGYVVDGEIDVRIKNTNVRPKDYAGTASANANFANAQCVPRPSHADYVAYIKDGKISSGGGRFSGRLTAPLCIAGGIAEELLLGAHIRVCAYISSIGGVQGASYKTSKDVALNGVSKEDEQRIKASDFPLLDESVRGDMENAISNAASEGDSVGGIIECVVSGLEAGMLGDALFEGLEGKIAYSLYAIPAVKGVEFGGGFDLANMRGSEANDSFALQSDRVVTATNNSGGINGGICNGMPLTLRVAVRPTPSIFKTQKSVDLTSMTECELSVKGRHDACIAVRAVPCVESAVALALLDELLKLREGIELYSNK
ncbi:MAG: chorismate synthase [Clostridia bacterium]|nr:chorismate synthase [Clostridia bacterium]